MRCTSFVIARCLVPQLAECHGELVCGEHKTDDMINTKKKATCKNTDCSKVPAYGVPDGKRMYCRNHAEPDMIDLAHKRCTAQGCKKQANYGEYKYCSEHHQPQQVEEDRVERKPASTLTGVLVDAARAHCQWQGGWHPSESPAQPSAATAEPRVTTPSAVGEQGNGEGGEQPTKPAPPSAGTAEKEILVDRGIRRQQRAPAWESRSLLKVAITAYTADSQTAPTSLAATSPPSSACATTNPTPKPVAASSAVGEGEECDGRGEGGTTGEVNELTALLSAACLQGEGERGEAAGAGAQSEGEGAAATAAVAAGEVGREERVDTSPAPAPPSECDVGGEEMVAQLVDRVAGLETAATGAGQRETAGPASAQTVPIGGGLGVLAEVAAAAGAAEADGVQSEGKRGAAESATATGEVGREERVPPTPAPATTPTPAVPQASAPAPAAPQGTSSSSGGEGDSILAPASYSGTGAMAGGGGRGGGSGSEGGHEHEVGKCVCNLTLCKKVVYLGILNRCPRRNVWQQKWPVWPESLHTAGMYVIRTFVSTASPSYRPTLLPNSFHSRTPFPWP